MELTAAMFVAFLVAAWRMVRGRPRTATGPLPDVGDAPPGAEPIARYRPFNDGLGAYWMEFREAPSGAQVTDGGGWRRSSPGQPMPPP